MKKSLLSIVFVFICGCLVAQKNYEKSETFPEFDGWTKIIQLRNSNTGLMEVTKKTGINFTLFNPQRKKITSGKLPLAKIGEKLALSNIEGVYDIGGDYVAFILAADEDSKRKPVMYRIVIDGSTGKLKSEEKIDELQEISMGDGYGMVFGDTDVPRFIVEKDPDSDYYAVVRYNSVAAETIDRIQVSHFGPDHKLINKAKYNTPTDKYKYTKLLAAYVRGGEYVLIGTSAFNTKKSGGDEIRYYAAQLNAGKTTFTQKELQYQEFDKKAKSYFLVNKPKDLINMILLVTIDYDKNTVKKKQINQHINPTSLALEKPFESDMSKVNELYKSQLTNKKDYGGLIQGSFVDMNGNVTYLYQEITKETRTSNFVTQVVGTIFGDVALVTMSPEGKEIASAVFPCNIYRRNDHDPFDYNNISKGRRAGGGITPVADNDWYYSMDFLSTENASYIFFNNRLDNMERPDKDEAARIAGISGTHGVKYTFKDGKITKEYMFGKPASKKEAKFINPGSSDFNAASKTYATVLTDPETKTAIVCWTKLD